MSSYRRTQANLEVHLPGIGIDSQTARLVFTSKVGSGCTATVVDLGNRFRLIVNDVECIEPKPSAQLPVASALWIPMPNFEVGAGAWILAGGTHHSCFSYDLTAEYWEDYAEIAGIEMVAHRQKHHHQLLQERTAHERSVLYAEQSTLLNHYEYPMCPSRY